MLNKLTLDNKFVNQI